MDTLKELFKVGNVPSSSHTMGPQRAAEVVGINVATALIVYIIKI